MNIEAIIDGEKYEIVKAGDEAIAAWNRRAK